jgi:hypothetical protein
LPTPVPFERNLGEPHRLRADRFARVLGVSYAEAHDLYAALIADPAYVDVNGFVLPAADSAAVVQALPSEKRNGVLDQLKALRAERHVSSQYRDSDGGLL